MNPYSALRRHLAASMRHRWVALLVAWLVCGAGWFGVQLLPTRYESSARLYADADAMLSLLLRGIAIDATPTGQMEILQRTLLSRPNLAKIISSTDLDSRVTNDIERDELVGRLARDIRITTQTRNLFTIDFRDHNPRVARDVVQATVTLFFEAASATDRQQMDSARGFVAQQIASYELQLRQAERRRAEFQARYIDVLPSEALGGASRLETARERLLQVRGDLQDARTRREIIETQIAQTSATVAPEYSGGGGGGGGGNPRAAEAERQLRELRLRLTDAHPDVVAARRILSESQSSGGGGSAAPRGAAPSRPLARANPLMEQLRVRLVDVDGQIASLTRQERTGQAEVDRLDGIARNEPELQAQAVNMNRDYAVLRRNYEELLARRESLAIDGAARTNADRVRLEVVDPPVVPTRPVAPNRPLMFSGVLIGGILAGLLAAFALSRLDRSFYSLLDLRRLGLPVLGGVSAPRSGVRTANALAFSVCGLLLLAGYGAVVSGVPAKLVRFLA